MLGSRSGRVQGQPARVSAMLRKLIISTGAVLALILPAAGQAQSVGFEPLEVATVQDRFTAEQARDQRQSGDIVPALRVISAVRREYPGADVLDAELERGPTPRYIIKILTRDGRRVDVVADARTGRILYER